MFSANELEIMELLWAQDCVLSRSEIIELSPQKSWKPSTIHLLLNSLLKKGGIKVDGFKQTGKNYGRVFAANLTREEYTAKMLSQSLPKSGAVMSHHIVGVFAALVNQTSIDKNTLEELQHILDEQKKVLNE